MSRRANSEAEVGPAAFAIANDHPHAFDIAFDQADEKLLIFTVSDEALEKAAGDTIGAQTYPSTCQATNCIREGVVGAG